MSPKTRTFEGHVSTQAGTSPRSTRLRHRSHFSTTPLSSRKNRALYGQAIMQYRQPTQSDELMATMPSALWKDAPVGQTRTQAGEAQWWHCSGSETASSLGYSPRISTLSQSRLYSSGTPFSARQATTQALQLRHLRESITI